MKSILNNLLIASFSISTSFSLLSGIELEGWPVLISDYESIVTNIVVGDVDGDDDLEVAVGTGSGLVAIYHHDGTPLDGWPITLEDNVITTPTFVDIDRDGDLEIFVSAGIWVYGFHHDGNSVAGWPTRMGRYTISHSTIAAGDIDGDGDYELVHGSGPDANRLFIWHHDGTPVEGWPIRLAGFVSDTSPTLADFDNDGDLEIVVGTADFVNQGEDYEVHVFHHDASLAEGWPQAVIEPIYKSSPAVGDIDQDGELEIVDGTSFHSGEFAQVYAWNFDGTIVEGWPWTKPEGGEIEDIALGDVDQDGKLEVAITSMEGYGMYILNGEDGTLLPGWPQTQDPGWTMRASPVITDIDGDNELEIVASGATSNYPWIEFRLYAFNGDGTEVVGFPIGFPRAEGTTPTIVDIDGDGDLEIGVSTRYGVFIGSGPAYIHFWDLEASLNEEKQIWPTYCHDRHHTGLFGQLMPEDGPVTVDMIPDTLEGTPGDTLCLSVSLENRNVVYESFLAAIFLTLPDGNPFPGNPFVGPYSLRIPMEGTITHEFSFPIPRAAPLGEYSLTGLVGKSPAWIYDFDITAIILDDHDQADEKW